MKNTTYQKGRQQGHTLTIEKMIAARKKLLDIMPATMPQYIFSAEHQKFFKVQPTIDGVALIELDNDGNVKPKDPTRDAAYHFPLAESKSKMVK